MQREFKKYLVSFVLGLMSVVWAVDGANGDKAARNAVSVREFDALERTARPKSMLVSEYLRSELSKHAVAAGAYADETEPPLRAKIAAKWPVVKTDLWQGGRRTVLTFKGHEAWVVEPPAGVATAKGCPWTWTMQWAAAFVERTGVPELLKHGWRHVTLMQFDERMTEEGLALSWSFQEYLVSELGFAPQANLIGMSWGGFFAVRYATAHPELVKKVHLDAPLLTFDGSALDVGPWKGLAPKGGWATSPEMPVNRAAILAKAGIPVLLLYGTADRVVNPALNSLAFVKAYEASGGTRLDKIARAFGHHPHGVDVGDATVSCFFQDGAAEACANGQEDKEKAFSMLGPAEFVRDMTKEMPAKEVVVLERLAAAQGQTLTDYVMAYVHEEAAYRGANDTWTPRLASKIAEKWPIVRTDEWQGGRRTVFTFKGREAWVVEPCPGAATANGRPWTWTMQWATAFVPRTGVPRLLRKGWHHVTLMQFDERMTEEGLALSRSFQEYLVSELGFAPQANLIGMSWGGFFAVRYATAHPELVKKVYLDAPLLTFDGSALDVGPWKGLAPKGGWATSPEMPVNRAAILAKAGIPVLLFYGGADTVVPPKKNGLAFIDRYKAAGGTNLEVCPRASFAHHPHGVEPDNTTISDFFADEGYFKK